MPSPAESSSPGKIILCGEHAVVYGVPAVAVPVTEVAATAKVEASPSAEGVVLQLPAIAGYAEAQELYDLPDDNPFRKTVELAQQVLGLPRIAHITISVTSTIPIAGGLGSGAAVSAAMTRALAQYFGREVSDAEVSDAVFEVEKIHHGTPSGIDNTVISFAKPVYFRKGVGVEVLSPKAKFSLVIGDTGKPSPTKTSVGMIREWYHADGKAFLDERFEKIRAISERVRSAIEDGTFLEPQVVSLLNENHALLAEMHLSSPELENLVAAARSAGALAAKLSGGGQGGNMIAIVPLREHARVAEALEQAGARRVFITHVEP